MVLYCHCTALLWQGMGTIQSDCCMQQQSTSICTQVLKSTTQCKLDCTHACGKCMERLPPRYSFRVVCGASADSSTRQSVGVEPSTSTS
jgi:hypothetical protein